MPEHYGIRLRQELQGVPALRDRIQAAIRPRPVAGSIADRDHRLPCGGCSTIFAGQALAVAGDHLFAWHLIVETTTLPTFAHMTLLRSVLEAAVRCRWLVDQSVTPEERRARGVASQIEAVNEHRKFEETFNQELIRRPQSKRLAAFRKLLAQRGIEPRQINVAEMFDRYATGSGLWRLTSGFAHGRSWAILSGERIVVEEGARGQASRIQTAAAGPDSLKVTALAVQLTTVACQEFEGYVRRRVRIR